MKINLSRSRKNCVVPLNVRVTDDKSNKITEIRLKKFSKFFVRALKPCSWLMVDYLILQPAVRRN